MAYQPAKPQIYAYPLVLFFLLLLCSPLLGQTFHTLSETSRKAKKAFETAELAYRTGDFEASIPLLQKAVKEDQLFIEAWLMLGDAASESDSLNMAVLAYEKAYHLSKDFFPGLGYLLSKTYVDTKKHEKALEILYQFELRTDISEQFRSKAAELISIAAFRKEAYENPVDIALTPFPDAINTPADEYINALRMNGEQILFTRRELVDEKKPLVEKVLLAERSERGFNSADAFEPDQWPFIEQIGAITFSADGKSIVFAACGWPDGKGSCDIYWSDFIQGKWTVPVNLEKLNSGYWESQPTLSVDGNSLIFSSNRPGGNGGSDLWISHFQNGKWTEPQNMGEFINTTGNEMAPFWHFDSQSLYFSSDGHPGMGGMDLFLSRKDTAGFWQKPVNLGFPINRESDEINLVVDAFGSKAMISAKADSADNYDIYSFDLPESLRPTPVTYIEFLVTNKETKLPLQAEITVADPVLAVDLVRIPTNKNGLAFVVLPANEHLALQVQSDQYLYYEKSFRPEKGTATKPVQQKVELEPLKTGKTIVLENILFELNKAILLPEAFAGLKNLENFLKQNPGLQISLEGHTDNTGEEDFNRRLSFDRANAVADFLIVNGISNDRILVRGFGADQPIASNEEEDGRAKNRRVELRIIE